MGHRRLSPTFSSYARTWAVGHRGRTATLPGPWGAGADLGVVAEGPVTDVVQEVLDGPVASDPGWELGWGGIENAEAGGQVDAFDGELPGFQITAQRTT
jgi:hypothetical protein